MNRLLAIVRREYLERVRTGGFIVGTVMGPLLVAVLLIVPLLLGRAGAKMLRVAVLEEAGAPGSQVEEKLREARDGDRRRFEVRPSGHGPLESRRAALEEAMRAGSLDGYLELPADILADGRASYYGRNVSNLAVLRLLERSAGEVIVAARLAGAGLDPARISELTQPLDMKRIRINATEKREDAGVAALLLPAVLMMILLLSILMWGQSVMTSVVEEKTSRVIEVVASGVSADHILWGKLLGVSAVGLTQFLVWVLSMSAASLLAAGPLASGIDLPEITSLVLSALVIFFLLGFLFYATLFAAIGSSVNTTQEAQNLVYMVLLPLVMGAVCFPTVIDSPESGLAVAMSLIPLTSPIIMFIRIVVLTPPAWQVGLSLTLLVLSIAGAMWASARIYRVGILMYGKRPTVMELVRWIRQA